MPNFLERNFPTFLKALGALGSAKSFGFAPTQAGNWGAGIQPGSRYNYGLAAGDLWKNNTVFACLSWARRTFPEAPLAVSTVGTDEMDHAHPLAALLRRPNPFYGRYTLWGATVLSYIVDGNAYWFKVRNGLGEVTELYYRPHWQVTPVRGKGGAFIDYYNYTVSGKVVRMETTEVVHMRNGLDPENEVKGLSDLAALLRTVVTDNEATSFCAAMLRNMGMPGPMITPKAGTPSPTREQALAIKQSFLSRTTGDNVGMPIVIDGEYDVNYPVVNLDGAALLNIRKLSQSDIAAAIGIPAVVVGLLVGLETGTAKASHEDARRQAYESFVQPVQASIGEDLDIQLMPDFDPSRQKQINWDYSGVSALAPNQNDLAERWVKLYQGGVCMRSEARAKVGLDIRDGGDDDVFILASRETLLDVNGDPIASATMPIPSATPPALAALNGAVPLNHSGNGTNGSGTNGSGRVTNGRS